ncbi:MAG: sugar transferase [Bacteroidales bacterium]|nr:sugar transferase [Bacteroidales bacterium]
MKRLFDLVCVFFASIFFSPFFIAVYIAIKLEDGGPAIFKQERIGRGGKPFMLYKFRSMKVNAEGDGKPQLWQGEEDARLTKVGKFIRNHHLDELPQFWNIWKGDMSFVGYRPERQYFIDQIVKENPDYVKLYAMRPGVFSEATLYNGYTDTMEKMLKRLEMDLDYMERQSLWLDIVIIFKTGVSILTGKKF